MFDLKLARITLNNLSQTVDLIDILDDYCINVLFISKNAGKMIVAIEDDCVVLRCLAKEISNKNLDAIITVIEAENDSKKDVAK